ncbi:MAG: hypothetical protein QM756_42560 [Polyangiaceae bacterium]
MSVISRFGFLVVGMCVACGAESAENVGEAPQALKDGAFDVDFSGCTEVAGIGFVPAANARPLVPSSYTLAGDANNAVIVVRSVECKGVSVDGKPAKRAISTQIGISVVGQDTTADINNYTLWFVTDLTALQQKLSAAGVPAESSQRLKYTLSRCSDESKLDFVADPARAPHHELHGDVVTPTAPPGQFIASWWAGSGPSAVRVRTVFPNIRFGTAHMTLTTPAGSALARLIGGTSMTFALLDSYNSFASAHLEVRAAP